MMVKMRMDVDIIYGLSNIMMQSMNIVFKRVFPFKMISGPLLLFFLFAATLIGGQRYKITDALSSFR